MTSEPCLESTSDMMQGHNYGQSQYNFIVIEESSGTSKNNPSTCRVSLSNKIAGVLSQGRKDCFSVESGRIIAKGWEIGKTVGYWKWLPPLFTLRKD